MEKNTLKLNLKDFLKKYKDKYSITNFKALKRKKKGLFINSN